MNNQGTRQPRGHRTGISLATVMLCWMTVLLCIPAIRAASITPAFTYQGNLSADGAPANGLYDFRFTLHGSSNGSAIGTGITNSSVVVTQGHFTVLLDFGPDAFTGAERWLEIGARTNGALMEFTTLVPRQVLTPTPHSIVASQLAGPLPSGFLSGDYTSAVTITNAANVFGGNGAGLTGLNASQIATGTLADARLGANVALLNRTNQAFTGINTFSGNVGIGKANPADTLDVNGGVTATTFTGNGSALTGLSDGNLSANVALLNRNNQAFAGDNLFFGKVGIGTTTPSQKLHVVAGSGTEVRVENTGSGTAALGLVNADREYSVRMTQSKSFVVRDVTDGNADRLTIATNGYVGIGKANPADTLHVNGGVTATTFTGSGAGLTGVSVSASEITSGTLADAQLGANVALLNRNNQAFTGDNLFSGKVGIGTTTTSQKLHVVAGSGTEVRVENTGSGSAALGLVNADREYSVRMTGTESFVVRDVTDGNADRLTIATNGYVGIGTTTPKQALHVNGDYYGKGHFYLHAYEGDGVNGTAYVQARDDSGSSSIGLKFRTQKEGNIVEAMQLGWDGITYVNVLTITGGADIAEPFHVHSGEDIVPGMVVSIDPDRTGELRLSSHAYDHTVAGIISGAGGVKTGMTLQQTGTLADGKHPVALTGRVWCHVDADSASVKPGDLLTTSDTPGHAMKALDPGRAQGAIIGKAMTKLESGRGLVLVLVSLQ